MRKKIISAILSVAMVGSMLGAFTIPASAATAKTPKYQTNARPMERLNRGLIAAYRTVDSRSIMSGEGGVYLSWRLLGKEDLTNQAFEIYRSTSETGTFSKVGTTAADGPTNYIDTSGNTNHWYKVIPAGKTGEALTAALAAEKAVQPTANYTAKASEVRTGNSLQNSFTYVDIPIERPDPVERMGDSKKSYYYTYDSTHEGGANDGSVGDLDGDGDYELVLKWDPTDSKDSSGSDFTGNVFIDAYEIDPGNKASYNENGHLYKWRIDLGKNVTAGAHYTQYIVYDFDNDGRAEIAMKTGPGSKDGTGRYVTEVGDTEEIRNYDNAKSYIGTSGDGKGKNIYGKEFLTVFDGETGAALATTEYIPLGKNEDWNTSKKTDKYNRCERFLAGVAYLDGVTPSIIMCRGYYAKAVVRAYNFDGENLSMVWEHDSSTIKTYKADDNTLYGQGAHSLSISDIDNDGFDEIVYCSAAIDHDGKVIGNTKLGHGDALHVSDFNNDGIQEAFSVKEESAGYTNNAADFRIPTKTPSVWGHGASGDTGRGVMANIDDAYAQKNSNAMALGWSSSHAHVFGLDGSEVNPANIETFYDYKSDGSISAIWGSKPYRAGSGSFDNSLVYWDGDLSRELLDANIIQKYDAENGQTKRFYGPGDGYTLMGGTTNNYTKRNATLSADLWGDWREEVILPINKNSQTDQAYLRIFTSTIWTDYRLTTLMHDCQYREAIAWQNVGYNQPPHQSYYIGSAALATDENGTVKKYLAPETGFTKVIYPDEIPVTHVTGITLDKNTLSVEKKKTAKLTATITPDDATKKNVIWTSSDEGVASVSNGIVTAIGVGTATITATASDNGENGDSTFSATCDVTVTSNPVTGVTLNKTSAELPLGDQLQLTANVVPANASEQGIEWVSSNPAIATVSDEGLVTTTGTGLVTIHAISVDDDTIEATCVINVLPEGGEDKTGSNEFVMVTESEGNTLSNNTATSATLTQTNSAVGQTIYKTFDEVNSGKARFKFKFTTGGKQIDGSTWNWINHAYTMYVKILGDNDANILTFKQPWTYQKNTTTVSAGKLTTKVGSDIEEDFATGWTPIINEAGNISGSANAGL